MIGNAKGTLQELAENYNLSIISNGYAGFVYATLDFYNLRKYFTKIIISQEVNIEKPDPRIFYLALNYYNIQPEQAMMVGDSYESDICGPKSLGMKTCWVNPEKKMVKEL